MSEDSPIPAAPEPRWQPLSAMDRRVAGVLAEKGKTTPDAYPLSLNAIRTGCNQKSNRDPIMQLEPADVEESLDRLRQLGAVGIVEGYGRVAKYRHYLYNWLGVEKVELSVITELLLRGDQTEGELRARASRMDSIPELATLRNLLSALKTKGLVVSLTREGRGHVVTHNLYKPREMEVLKAKYGGGVSAVVSREEPEKEQGDFLPQRPAADLESAPGPAQQTPAYSWEPIRRELEDLRAQLASFRTDLQSLTAAQRQAAEELRRLKQDLGA